MPQLAPVDIAFADAAVTDRLADLLGYRLFQMIETGTDHSQGPLFASLSSSVTGFVPVPCLPERQRRKMSE